MLSSSQLVVTIPSLLLRTHIKIVDDTVCQEVAVTNLSLVLSYGPFNLYACAWRS